ncbi:hypothetical protein [Halomicrobium salinisoli]|uniref:hypothetical protein n=1 Tax=Halomicrobium salinisoli TaxID=2878391 RepID=UPI001CF08B99|nr:hypothetical protein [Halomicrobium salinisoli]
MTENRRVPPAHLRALHTAIVGVGLSILTGALVVADEPLAFSFLIATLLVLGYSLLSGVGGT